MFTQICWFITILATFAASFQLLFTFTAAQSAPQQAAGAAMAAAMVIVPYVFTRAVEGLGRPAAAASEAPEKLTLDLRR